jgi:hypothetical protein
MANCGVCEKWKETKAAIEKRVPKWRYKIPATSNTVVQNAKRARASDDQVVLR